MIQLVVPSLKYQASYIAGLKEFQAEGRDFEYRAFKEGESFEDFIDRINGFKKGLGLPAGYVPETILWLIDNGEYIGEVSIRHELTDALLKWGGHIGYFLSLIHI